MGKLSFPCTSLNISFSRHNEKDNLYTYINIYYTFSPSSYIAPYGRNVLLKDSLHIFHCISLNIHNVENVSNDDCRSWHLYFMPCIILVRLTIFEKIDIFRFEFHVKLTLNWSDSNQSKICTIFPKPNLIEIRSLFLEMKHAIGRTEKIFPLCVHILHYA